MEVRESWINLLYKAATGTKKTRTLLTPVGLLIFGVFSSLFVLLAILVDRLLGLPGLLPEIVRLPFSVPVVALGIIVTGWSAIHFLKVKGTPVPFNPPPKLVNTGPYRYARNPMLTGVFLFLFGVGGPSQKSGHTEQPSCMRLQEVFHHGKKTYRQRI